MIERVVTELGPWAWWVLGIVLLILEVLMPGVFLVWIGIAAIITGALSLALWETAFWTWHAQWLVFAVLSLIAAIIGRRIVSSRGQTSDQRNGDDFRCYVGMELEDSRGHLIDARPRGFCVTVPLRRLLDSAFPAIGTRDGALHLNAGGEPLLHEHAGKPVGGLARRHRRRDLHRLGRQPRVSVSLLRPGLGRPRPEGWSFRLPACRPGSA